MIRSPAAVLVCVGACCLAVAGASGQSQSTSAPAGEQFGASPDALGPIGGGAGYKGIIEKADFRVSTIDELLKALKEAKPGQVVYVDDKSELDFSVRVVVEKLIVEIPGGVTLAGGRGRDGSQGALLCSDVLTTSPLIRVAGPKVHITGLRIQGPDPKVREAELARLYDKKLFEEAGNSFYYRFPTCQGIAAAYPNLEIDNCELSGWSHSAVYLQEGARGTRIHHNSIHHCQRRGLGYGVCLDVADAVIESNVFDYYRHAIAATGRPGTRYEACNNLVLGHAVSHAFDMHGGSDRKDGTEIAGDWIRIHHNTFKVADQADIVIRGQPIQGGEVHHNVFLHADPKDTYKQAVGSNVRIYRNQYGPQRVVGP